MLYTLSFINNTFYLATPLTFVAKLISFFCPQGADAADEETAATAVTTNSGGRPAPTGVAAAVVTTEEGGVAAAAVTTNSDGRPASTGVAAAAVATEEDGAAAVTTNPEATKDAPEERECVLDIGCSRCLRVPYTLYLYVRLRCRKLSVYVAYTTLYTL